MARLITYFLLLSVLTVSLVSYVAFQRSKQALEQAVFAQLEATAMLKEDGLILMDPVVYFD